IGMHILEAILQDDSGISNICSPVCDHLLKELMRTWDHLVTLLAVDQDFSPRLLFHVIRCYVLLCNNVGGYRIITEGLPDPIISGSFHDIAEKFPVIGSLLRQLLLTVGRTNNCILASESINLQV
ncbi:Cell differentiation protein, partial [Fagus crenata]